MIVETSAYPAKPQNWLEARPRPVASVATLLVLFMISGMFSQMLALAVPAIVADWGLPETALASPMAAVLVGSGIGTVAGGAIADSIGRRMLIAVSLLLLCMFAGAAAFARTPMQLALPIFLGGVAMGSLYAAAMALITELVPDKRRPFIISITVAALPVGLAICSGLGALMLPTVGWRPFFLLVASVGLPVLVAFFWFVPESPSFLARAPGRRGEYERVIARLGLDPVADPHGDAAQSVEVPLATRLAAVIRANPRGTFGLWGLFFATYIFGNAILSWLPLALSNLGFGISFASGAITAWTIASMSSTPLAGWLISRLGMRTEASGSALLAGFVALALTIATISGTASAPLIIAILALGGMSAAGIVVALYTLVAAAYPPAVRGVGVGLSDAIGRIGGMSAAFFGVHIIARGGPPLFFAILAGLMLLVAIYLRWIHPTGEKG